MAFRVNGMVVRVQKPAVASGNYWQVLLAYQVARKSVLVLPERPDIGTRLPEGIVKWVKPDDEKPGFWAVGVSDSLNKLTKRKWVFTTEVPAIGQWMQAEVL